MQNPGTFGQCVSVYRRNISEDLRRLTQETCITPLRDSLDVLKILNIITVQDSTATFILFPGYWCIFTRTSFT